VQVRVRSSLRCISRQRRRAQRGNGCRRGRPRWCLHLGLFSEDVACAKRDLARVGAIEALVPPTDEVCRHKRLGVILAVLVLAKPDRPSATCRRWLKSRNTSEAISSNRDARDPTPPCRESPRTLARQRRYLLPGRSNRFCARDTLFQQARSLKGGVWTYKSRARG
jgi:hypothetical protein